VSSFLQPVGEHGELLFSIGRELDAAGFADGVKIELFDVSDMSAPRTLGASVFGRRGSASEAVFDAHAATFLSMNGAMRIALPIDVFDVPHPNDSGFFQWRYSGMHLFEVTQPPQGDASLRFHGVVKSGERSGPGDAPPYADPQRTILHGPSVFVVHGEDLISEFWGDVRTQADL
jgi:hypothetical protein